MDRNVFSLWRPLDLQNVTGGEYPAQGRTHRGMLITRDIL